MSEPSNGLRFQVQDLVRRMGLVEDRCGKSEADVPVLKQRVDGMQDILIEIREEQRWQRRALQGLLLTVISSVLVAALLTFVGAGP